jgi:ABC-type lipoprotein release transport system permease subunit
MLLLLAVISFALFSRVAEYAVTMREVNRIAESFIGVGAAERQAPNRSAFNIDEALMADKRISPALTATMSPNAYDELLERRRYVPLSIEEIEAVLTLPYVTRGSTRYMGAGISEDGFLRAAPLREFYNYTERLIIEGTLSGVRESWGQRGHRSAETRILHLTDLKVLAGEPRIKANVESYFPFNMYLLMFQPDVMNRPYNHVFRYRTIDLTESVIVPEFEAGFTRELTRGERYIFTASFDASRWLYSPVYSGDRAMQTQIPSIFPLADAGNYHNLDELIDLINDDRHTFDMVYTDDMRAIMRFHEDKMRIIQGRMLVPEDTINTANVCVVSRHFMNTNNLQLGDTITMRLGDALHGQNAALGAVAVVSERRHNPGAEVIAELEIVGVYSDVDSLRAQVENPYWTYTNNTIFLPLSLLPPTADTAGQEVLPSEFSFVIDNPRNIPAFLQSSAPALESMGLTLFFSDGGWLPLEQHFDVTGRLSVIAIAGFSFAALITLALTVYLFIGRKKKDYAIMRALGTTKLRAGATLFVPLVLVALIAIISGSICGFIYTGRTIEDNFTVLSEIGLEANRAVPVTVLLGFILVKVAALCGLTLLGLRRLGAQPPLALLQSSGSNAKKAKPKPEKTMQASLPELGVIPKADFTAKNYNAVRFLFRYTLLRSIRAPVKSLLMILITATFLGAIGQFAAMRHSYRELFETLEVKGKFLNGMPLPRAQAFGENDFAAEPYYELVLEGAEVNGRPAIVNATNYIERFVENSESSIIHSPYLHPEAWTGENDALCLLGADLMDALGVGFGDEVQVYFEGFKTRIREQNRTADDERFNMLLRRQSAFYTVAGRLESDNEEYNKAMFVPVNDVIEPLFRNEEWGFYIPLTYVEFTLADNYLAEEFRAYGIRRSGDRGRSFVMDTGELESVSANMELWQALFPVITIALIIMGGLFSALIVLQSSKEAAIFRILSATKKRVRVLLTAQQAVFGLAGIVLGITAVRLYNGREAFSEVMTAMILCAAPYFAVNVISAALCAINATKHNVLELLQTKE